MPKQSAVVDVDAADQAAVPGGVEQPIQVDDTVLGDVEQPIEVDVTVPGDVDQPIEVDNDDATALVSPSGSPQHAARTTVVQLPGSKHIGTCICSDRNVLKHTYMYACRNAYGSNDRYVCLAPSCLPSTAPSQTVAHATTATITSSSAATSSTLGPQLVVAVSSSQSSSQDGGKRKLSLKKKKTGNTCILMVTMPSICNKFEVLQRKSTALFTVMVSFPSADETISLMPTAAGELNV